MIEETRVALMNYDWLIRNDGLDEIELYWPPPTDTLGLGFTPATLYPGRPSGC